MCPQGTGKVDEERWVEYLNSERAAKNNKIPGSGDTWLSDLVLVLRQGAEVIATKHALPSGVNPIPAELYGYTKDTFWFLTNCQEGSRPLTKKRLSSVSGHDFGLWATLDPQKSGIVSLPKWLAYFEAIQKLAHRAPPQSALPYSLTLYC